MPFFRGQSLNYFKFYKNENKNWSYLNSADKKVWNRLNPHLIQSNENYNIGIKILIRSCIKNVARHNCAFGFHQKNNSRLILEKKMLWNIGIHYTGSLVNGKWHYSWSRFWKCKGPTIILLRPRKHFPSVCKRFSYVKIIFLQIISVRTLSCNTDTYLAGWLIITPANVSHEVDRFRSAWSVLNLYLTFS